MEPDTSTSPAVPPKIATVLRDFERTGIRYCHWKTNWRIQQALAGEDDLDLLVEKEDFAAFVIILLRHGFKQAEGATSRRQPGIFHFLGVDDICDGIIHVHAHARILTGDHVLKTWALPMERLLLEDTHRANGIRIPSKASELVIFVLRSMIKHTTLLDLYLRQRSRKEVLDEYRWLVAGAGMTDCDRKLAAHFPMISPVEFRAALESIGPEGTMLRRIRWGFRFQRALARYRRNGRVRQAWWNATSLCRIAIRKLAGRRESKTLPTGGALIALAGPPTAVGSALVEKVRRWLGQQLSVRAIHLAEPAGCQSNEQRADKPRNAWRRFAALIQKRKCARRRRRLLRRAYRDSRNGQIVLCDGYSRQEADDDRDVCSPDLVLELQVGEVTPDDPTEVGGHPVKAIRTNGDPEETFRSARRVIWEHL